METTVQRTREEVRAAFREAVRRKRDWIEQSTLELERIHSLRQAGKSMEEIFQ